MESSLRRSWSVVVINFYLYTYILHIFTHIDRIVVHYLYVRVRESTVCQAWKD